MSILSEADALINGDRQESYGDPKENLKRIAALWTDYLGMKYKTWGPLTPEDICWMMVLLKMARQMHKPGKDNLVDAAGYIGLVEKVIG